MKIAPIADRLQMVVNQRNRELASDAFLKIVFGIIFSLFTFAFVFWLAWFVSCGVSGSLGLDAWQLAALVSAVFALAAIWSAWRRVNPLADVKPLTDRQMMHMLVSQTAGLTYFSPRHATAGAAVVLIGGPAGVFEGIGIWFHRLPADRALIEEAAQLLMACQEKVPAKQVQSRTAAHLLKRLTLIKVVDSAALALTEKGTAIVVGGKKRKDK